MLYSHTYTFRTISLNIFQENIWCCASQLFELNWKKLLVRTTSSTDLGVSLVRSMTTPIFTSNSQFSNLAFFKYGTKLSIINATESCIKCSVWASHLQLCWQLDLPHKLSLPSLPQNPGCTSVFWICQELSKRYHSNFITWMSSLCVRISYWTLCFL